MGIHFFDRIDTEVRAILDRALDGQEISWQEALRLCAAGGNNFHAIVAVADELRRRQAGDLVTYVINRNINFTNVCIKHCGFCAFSRPYRSEQGYFLPLGEIVRRVREAADLGATEVCIQAGLPPDLGGRFYIEVTHAVKAAAPGIHVHAFSPEEILYGAAQSGMSIEEYLSALKAAGLGSLPGTSAEILDQEVRDVISPGRITVTDWIKVITSAHALGIRTTSTMMYGHLETPEHWVRHMSLLRDIQKETRGFTEFVPLSMVHSEAPMYRRDHTGKLRPGPGGIEVVRVHAIARIMLGGTFRNIQASWVKEGPKFAQYLLDAGANDLGGTLMNESISTSAGAPHGQFMQPRELVRLIEAAGRPAAQRTTLYDVVTARTTALDSVNDADEQFGSYAKLAASRDFRFTR